MKLISGKIASQWDGSCLIGRELSSEKEAFSGKEAVNWE